MAPFRPGIGKIEVDGLDRPARKQVLDKIGGFDPEQAEVFQGASQPFAVDLSQASQQPFNPDKIYGRIGSRVGRQKASVPGPEFDFKRLGFGEEVGEVKRSEPGRRLKHQ